MADRSANNESLDSSPFDYTISSLSHSDNWQECADNQ